MNRLFLLATVLGLCLLSGCTTDRPAYGDGSPYTEGWPAPGW